jgi:hypothetical protein
MYKFDAVVGVGSSTEQSEVFSQTVKPFLDHFAAGGNTSFISYGQKGLGKSAYLSSPDGGLITESLKYLFASSPDSTYALTVQFVTKSYVALVDQKYDLIIQKSQNTTLASSEISLCGQKYENKPELVDWKDMLLISSLSEFHRYEAISRSELSSLVKGGKTTYANSHIVYTFRKFFKDKLKGGTLVFADLACSEKIRKSIYLGEQLLETVEKTSSLVYFSKCINHVLEGCRSKIMRSEDKLVDLLYESLGGNCRTCYIVSVSLAEEDKDMTFNTLVFAQKVSTIEIQLEKTKKTGANCFTAEPNCFESTSRKNQSSMKKNTTPIGSSWIEKCTNILDQNGSAMKKLEERNSALENQVLMLEQMLHLSQVDQSCFSKESAKKNVSFFSVENEFLFNNSAIDVLHLPKNPSVSLTNSLNFDSEHNEVISNQHEGTQKDRMFQLGFNITEQDYCQQKVRIENLIKSLDEAKAIITDKELELSTLKLHQERKYQNLLTKYSSLEQLLEDSRLEFEQNFAKLKNENKILEELNAEAGERESKLKDQILHLQNSKYQLHSDLQNSVTQSKLALHNQKVCHEASEKLSQENKVLHQRLVQLTENLNEKIHELEIHRKDKASMILELKELNKSMGKLEKENKILKAQSRKEPKRSPLKLLRDGNSSKSIAQLRAELRSEQQTANSVKEGDSEQDFVNSMMNSSYKSPVSLTQDDDMRYLSMSIGFKTSSDTHQKSTLWKDANVTSQEIENDLPLNLLGKLDIQVYTPEKKSELRIKGLPIKVEDFTSTNKVNNFSVSMAKATEKKREISSLLDIFSACQNAFETRLSANKLSEDDFRSTFLRSDIVKLWSEMEDCLNAEYLGGFASIQITFIQELLTKILTLFEQTILLRNTMASKLSYTTKELAQASRVSRCLVKFIKSLHIDDDLLLLKKERFLTERHSVAVLSRHYKVYKKSLDVRKLKRTHKTNHQLFQAGSGKFLLHRLMNASENYFLNIFNKIRPDGQSHLDKKMKQLVALAEIDSMCTK